MIKYLGMSGNGMWFSKKTKQLTRKVSSMDRQINESFAKVKNDMDTIHAWLNYFHSQHNYHENHFSMIRSEVIDSHKKTQQGQQELKEQVQQQKHEVSEVAQTLSKAIDQMEILTDQITEIGNNELNFNIEKISEEMNRLNLKVEELSSVKFKVQAMQEEFATYQASSNVTAIEQKVELMQQKLQTMTTQKSPKEKIVQKVVKKSHEYIKAVVVSYIKKYEKVSGFQLREMVVEEQNLTSKSTFYRILEEIEQEEEVTVIRQGKEKWYLVNAQKLA